MDWQALLNPDIQNFIWQHEKENVKNLALKKPPKSDWPYALIMDQIKARQKAQHKIPFWLDIPNIIFPSSDVMEQASSWACAVYKSTLITGKSFVDLTGGAGIDTAAFAEHYAKGITIEKDENTADILAQNLMTSGADHIYVKQACAEQALPKIAETDMIFIDPQRRDGTKRGIYDLSACSPNIMKMLPVLKLKTRFVILKTSPILDIKKTIADLEHVSAVHVIEYAKDCKELLFVLDFRQKTNAISITAISLNAHGQIETRFSYSMQEEEAQAIDYHEPEKYLYEPGPACMKSGGFKSIATQYGLKKLHADTHLYTSIQRLEHFPGRIFEIHNRLPVDKKILHHTLPDKKANISIRNFPSDVDSLKKKLKIKDGGEHYIFACTLHNNKKELILCKKSKSHKN